MYTWVRRTSRILAIAVAILAISYAVLHHSRASAEITPLTPCDNTACNSDCWADGTHYNPGTFAKRKSFNPGGCPTQFGCQTVTCP